MSALHDNGIFGIDTPVATGPDRSVGDVATALVGMIEPLRITPDPVPIETMTALWNTGSHALRLSVGYAVSLVTVPPQTRVRRRAAGAGPPRRRRAGAHAGRRRGRPRDGRSSTSRWPSGCAASPTPAGSPSAGWRATPTTPPTAGRTRCTRTAPARGPCRPSPTDDGLLVHLPERHDRRRPAPARRHEPGRRPAGRQRPRDGHRRAGRRVGVRRAPGRGRRHPHRRARDRRRRGVLRRHVGRRMPCSRRRPSRPPFPPLPATRHRAGQPAGRHGQRPGDRRWRWRHDDDRGPDPGRAGHRRARRRGRLDARTSGCWPGATSSSARRRPRCGPTGRRGPPTTSTTPPGPPPGSAPSTERRRLDPTRRACGRTFHDALPAEAPSPRLVAGGRADPGRGGPARGGVVDRRRPAARRRVRLPARRQPPAVGDTGHGPAGAGPARRRTSRCRRRRGLPLVRAGCSTRLPGRVIR